MRVLNDLRFAAMLCLLSIFAIGLTSSALAADESHGASAKHAEAGHSDGGHDEAGHAKIPGSIPEIDLTIFSLFTFLIFIALLTKFAWKPLREALDARESKIRGDLDEAEAARLKAQQLLAEHEAKIANAENSIREMIAQGKADAERVREQLVSAAQAEVQSLRQRSLADIESARAGALSELFDFVTNHVVDASSKVVGRSLTGDDQQRLVREALAELNLRN